ncbi:hypothetical protein LSAT2_001082 [Lamellibrachia satsuma]|nr:hypothetical protein LSAT2_001082 [Lamellibrachia satsuma]
MSRILFSVCLVAVLLTVGSTDRVGKVGNDIKASASGVDIAGATLIMNDMILTEGVVFAYSAYFRSDKPVRFQIWRPVVNETTNAYRLIGETRVIPSVKNDREDIYIESKLTEKCVRVRAGDRIGVYIEEAPGAIAYTFDGTSPDALVHTQTNVTEPQLIAIDAVVEFGFLTFPYDFSVTAYLDTNMSLYDATDDDFPACPKGLRIPDYRDVTLPPTSPAPPVTGRPGATGERGAQGMDGSVGATGPQGAMGERGQDGKTGPRGEHGATGPAGLNGSVGATGERGPMGLNGSKGDQGNVGATGAVGPRGLPGAVVTVQSPESANLETEDEGFFSNPMIIMALFIWVAVITIVVIVVIIVVAVTRRRRQTPLETVYIDHKPRPLIADDDDRPSWMGSMKEETEKNYSNETTTTRPDHPAALTTTNEKGSRQFDNAGFGGDDELRNY